MAQVLVLIAATVPPCPTWAQDRPRGPQGPAGTVTLAVGDYDRLVDRAARPPHRPDAPPIPAVVSRTAVEVHVADGVARGTLALEGEVFRTGPTKVDLVSSATVIDARMEGHALPLLKDGESHAAILQGPSPFAIALQWGAHVVTTAGRGSFVMPAVVTGTISAVIDLPGEQANVSITAGLITKRTTTAGRTRVEATLEAGQAAQVSWSVRESSVAGAERDVRALADVHTLLTLGDADVRMASLVDVTVMQGAPRTIDLQLPGGFELTGVTGSTIDTSDVQDRTLRLTLRAGPERRHRFLLTFEQAHAAGSFTLDTAFPTVQHMQRESGEIAIDGPATMELTATEGEGVRRMDVREVQPALRGLTARPLVAAFRYQRRDEPARRVALSVSRFSEAAVLAAAADRAIATTLVTTEGRTLTEVALWIRNSAQPFVRVTLTEGATVLSVDVGGEPAKPVTASDGVRVPLLRPGFRPRGPYPVSFVYLHAGAAFDKRGDRQLALPRIELPIGVLEWEVFLPDRYRVKTTAGNVLPGELVNASLDASNAEPNTDVLAAASAAPVAERGQILGRVTDASGASIPGATIAVQGPDRTASAISDKNGWYIVTDVPSGPVTVTATLAGFALTRRTLMFDQRPRLVDFRLQTAAVSETVTVSADAPVLTTGERGAIYGGTGGGVGRSVGSGGAGGGRYQKSAKGDENKDFERAQQAPSQNVVNMQRRVAGVLPIRIDVPRTGSSHRFVRPLVLDDATTVTFRYRTR